MRAAGNICSRQTFGDVQLHVEWQAPVKVEGMGQGRGNSGVFVLGGHYEVQVLDSYETNPADIRTRTTRTDRPVRSTGRTRRS